MVRVTGSTARFRDLTKANLGATATKKPAVVVIGPAWQSSGSYEAMRRQLECCARLGFATFFLAVSPSSGVTTEKALFWQDYLDVTANLAADARAHTALSRPKEDHWQFWTDYPAALWRSTTYVASLHTRLLDLPASLLEFVGQHEVTTIICNLFFNMPVAKKLSKQAPGAKIILETHDVQSYHHLSRKIRHPVFRRPSGISALLRDEMHISRGADAMVHYNESEAALFQKFAPDHRHHIIFPTVPRNHAPAGRTKGNEFDFLLVAARHDGNYKSIRWFFEHVWDAGLEASRSLKIVGDVVRLFEIHNPPVFAARRHHFLGRVEDLGDLYRNARAVLLPITEGQGIAVKTIEALSYGKKIIATPLAFRGFERHLPEGLKSEIARSPEDFRARLLATPGSGKPQTDARSVALYEHLFAPEKQLEAYRKIVLAALPKYP